MAHQKKSISWLHYITFDIILILQDSDVHCTQVVDIVKHVTSSVICL